MDENSFPTSTALSRAAGLLAQDAVFVFAVEGVEEVLVLTAV